MKNNNKRGFTIIEMVIVIAIIGILAAVLIPTYGNVVQNANESSAMQSCRSTMTNWLATYTSSAGVPQSFDTGKNNTYYPAYFEFKNENGTTYQYRYARGGIERTDDNLNKKLDTTVWEYAEVYLIDPSSVDPTKQSEYKTIVYKVNINKSGAAANDEIYYYTKLGAVSPYSCGGADVYMGFSGSTQCWVSADGTATATTLGATEGTMPTWQPASGFTVKVVSNLVTTGATGLATDNPVTVSGKTVTVTLAAALSDETSKSFTLTYKEGDAAGKTVTVTVTSGDTTGSYTFGTLTGNVEITTITDKTEDTGDDGGIGGSEEQ